MAGPNAAYYLDPVGHAIKRSDLRRRFDEFTPQRYKTLSNVIPLDIIFNNLLRLTEDFNREQVVEIIDRLINKK